MAFFGSHAIAHTTFRKLITFEIRLSVLDKFGLSQSCGNEKQRKKQSFIRKRFVFIRLEWEVF